MRSNFRRFFFRHHWWIVTVTAVIATIVIYSTSIADKATVFAAVVAGSISISFFIQQQRLAEMNLFRELITKFNERYDQLHDKLQEMRASETIDDYETVLHYFNLCAEEFLFYSEGYINERVWRSWCIGMLYYLDIEPFQILWNDLVTQDSYYGLTIEHIKAGAALPKLLD